MHDNPAPDKTPPYAMLQTDETVTDGGPCWLLYLIKTRQGQLYCGITTDIERRFRQHAEGKGARFLRGKGPLILCRVFRVGSHSDALKAELRVKKLKRSQKLDLIAMKPDVIEQIGGLVPEL